MKDLTQIAAEEIEKKFKESDYALTKPNHKKLIEFCAKVCPYVEKNNRGFFCPRLNCPRPQRLNYKRFLIRRKLLRRAKENYNFYEKYAITRLKKERTRLMKSKEVLDFHTKRSIRGAIRIRFEWEAKQIRKCIKILNQTIRALQRRIQVIEEKKKNVVVTEEMSQKIINSEISEFKKAISVMSAKILHAEGIANTLKKNVEHQKKLTQALQPLRKSARKISKGFDESNYKQKIIEKIEEYQKDDN